MELVDNFLDLGRNLIPDNIFQVKLTNEKQQIIKTLQAALQSAMTSYEETEGLNNSTFVTKSVTYR